MGVGKRVFRSCCFVLFACMLLMAGSCSSGGDSNPTGSANGCDNLTGTWQVDAFLTGNSCPILLAPEEYNPSGPVTFTVDGSMVTVRPGNDAPFTVQINCSGKGFNLEYDETETDGGCTISSRMTLDADWTSETTFEGTLTYVFSATGTCLGFQGRTCEVSYSFSAVKIG